MRKHLLLAMMLIASGAWQTAGAQTVPAPLCNITFLKESGSNSRVQNTGTAGNSVSEYDISVNKTGTVVNPMKGNSDLGKYIGYTVGTTDGYYWCKYNADDALGQAFGSTVTWEFLFRLDRLNGMTHEKYSTDQAVYTTLEQYNTTYTVSGSDTISTKIDTATVSSNIGEYYNYTYTIEGSDTISTKIDTIKPTAVIDYYTGKVEDASGRTIKFFSGQQSGGWCFRHGTKPNGSEGLCFDYVHASTNTYWATGKMLETGKFYHVVLSLNLANKTETLYINGEKFGSYTLKDNTFKYPNCGNPRRETNMWFNLGGDLGSPYSSVTLKADGKTVKSGTQVSLNTPGLAEQAARTSWVFARIYGTDLNESQALSLYNDDVKYYTEPTCPNKDDMLLDAVFGDNGAYADHSLYTTNTDYSKSIPVLGVKRDQTASSQTITTQWNTTQKRYEMVCPKSSANYTSNNHLIRRFMYDPSWEYQMSDAFSYEIYAKAGEYPTTNYGKCPLSFQQDGGLAMELNGENFKFNIPGYGFDTNVNTGTGTGMFYSIASKDNITSAGGTPTNYTHYVCTFDKASKKSYIYVNGVKVAENTPTDNITMQVSFPYTRYHWMAIGADTKNNIGSSADFPWYGEISIARAWSKTLTPEDVTKLYADAQNADKEITIGATGYATMRLPYIAKVPAGVEAYAVSEMTGSTATLNLIASENECLPYGTPVIIKGNPGTYTFEVQNTAETVSVGTNLLIGSFASKDVEEDEVYVLFDDGTGKAVLRKTEALTIPAGKAWLPAEDGGASAKTFVMGGLNAINTVKANNEGEAQKYYNLQGQRVMQPQRGIYILNGKKVFVK